ncbi:MAG: TylF/MycF family methyltransferase [Bacteroidales bacterium]|nr:TylF/MycF family methyltransferase [Bacteroidales bacterium]
MLDIKDKIVSLGIYYDKKNYFDNFMKINKLLQYDRKNYAECSVDPNQIAVIARMIYDHSNTSILNDESSLYHIDYPRYRTFELCADEVLRSNLRGAAAEIGVFRGGFSRIINKKFKSKTLYLFDTFESFDKKEYKKDSDSYKQTDLLFTADFFSSTNVDLVLKNMYYPKNCIIKKGYFPDTAKGLENEKFCFVSIDVDLYDPIYNSLEFFYPRLVNGGYLFIHEYNQQYFPGVNDAVKDYEKNSNTSLKKVPLADFGGTLIVSK